MRALADPFLVGSRAVTISASVGIAALSEDEEGTGVEAMLAHADIALYTAKRAGKGSFAVYDPLMTLPGTRALQLREPLRQALIASGFKLEELDDSAFFVGRHPA